MSPRDSVPRKLLICHVNMSAEFRGGERQTLSLIEALATRVEQRVVVRRGAPLHEKLARLRSHRIEIAPVGNSLLAATRAVQGADLLHIHEGRSVPVGALRSLRGTPFVVTRRVLKPPRPHWLSRWCYGRASCLVGVSEAVSALCRTYDAGPAVRTIRDCAPALPAPDPAATKALRDRYPGLLVGHVGELDDAAKGQRLTLAVARRFARERPDATFLLIGGGKDEAALRAEAHDLPNVHFTGRVQDVASHYAALDLYLFPSRSEALGSSILEAMSFGLAGAAARVGGIPEIISHGSNGLLFPPGDASALAECVARLIDEPELRKQMGHRALATAAAANPASMADAYQALYVELLR